MRLIRAELKEQDLHRETSGLPSRAPPTLCLVPVWGRDLGPMGHGVQGQAAASSLWEAASQVREQLGAHGIQRPGGQGAAIGLWDVVSWGQGAATGSWDAAS